MLGAGGFSAQALPVSPEVLLKVSAENAFFRLKSIVCGPLPSSAHERLQPVAVINHSYADAVPIGPAFVERPASDNQRRVRRKRLLGKEPLRERRQGPATSSTTDAITTSQSILHHVRILQGI